MLFDIVAHAFTFRAEHQRNVAAAEQLESDEAGSMRHARKKREESSDESANDR